MSDYERRRGSRPGVSRVIPLGDTTGATPPEWAVPGEGVYELQAVTFGFTGAGGGAARTPVVDFLDETGAVAAVSASPFTVASGSTSRLCFGVGLMQAGANNAPVITAPLPALRLTSHFVLFIAAFAGNPLDTYVGVRLIVREHLVDVEG